MFFYTAGTGFLVLSYPAFLREDSLAEMMVLVNVGGLGDQKPSYNFLIEQNAGRAGKRKNDLVFKKLLRSKEAAGLSNSVIGRKFSRLFQSHSQREEPVLGAAAQDKAGRFRLLTCQGHGSSLV